MRWDELFADLEGQLAHEADLEQRDLELEEERLRLGRLGLRERVAAMARDGDPVRLLLRGDDTLDLVVDTVGRDWLAGDARLGASLRGAIVPLGAVVAVTPTGDQLAASLRAAGAETAGSTLAAGLGIGFVLRDLARRRAVVDVRTGAGVILGTIDRVARDHLDLAERDEPHGAVRRIRIVPFEAITVVRVI